MAKLSVNQALIKAKSYEKKGEIKQAQKLYHKVLQTFPMNKRAQQGLAALKKSKQSVATQGSPQDMIDQLVNLYNRGQLTAVVLHAQALIEQYPDAFIIWNILGAAHKRLGKTFEASEAFEKVIEINPDYVDGHSNLGVTLQEQGKLDESIMSFKKALSLKPDYTEAHFNMGVTLKEQGKLEKAIEAYRKALALNPDYAEAYNNMGATLQGQGKLEEAIEAYKKALKLKSDYAEAYNNMGNAHKDQDKLEQAIEAYKKALKLKPDYAEAYNNMGNALKDQDKLEQAIKAYSRALSIKPDYAEAYNNMGNAHKDQDKLEQAIEAYKKALKLKPDYAEAYNNMGNALKDQDKLEQAIEAYKKALAIKPDYAEARAQCLHQLAHICDWDSIIADLSLVPELGTTNKDVSPFVLLPLEDAPERHRIRSKVVADAKFWQQSLPLREKPFKKPKRIRLGYFSTDFKEHPVAYLIAKMLEQHNRDQFEVFGYSLHGNQRGEMRQRLSKSFDNFADVHGISDKAIALLARENGIDIAINLNGYTQHARTGIFMYRAAPIQINYLGYPGTLGANFMDYIVADRFLIPEKNQKYFSEKQLYLPNTYMPTDNTRELSQKSISRSDMRLPKDAFVFCCFNNNYKISSAEFDIWMRLLNNIEGSVLWLRKSNQFSHFNMRKEAEKRNVDPSRLVFADKAPMEEHLARQGLADLFVDTFAFNAHTTATEALWAGLPVVTKAGQGFAARVAGSILNAVGLPELVTETEQDYEALILELATNPTKLAIIKKKLATNRLTQPLFNTEQYTKHLEKGYQQAYQKYFNGDTPDTIMVPK